MGSTPELAPSALSTLKIRGKEKGKKRERKGERKGKEKGERKGDILNFEKSSMSL